MKKIVFMGTPTFAVPVLEALMKQEYDVVLVVTQPDRPKGRRRTLTPPPVKEAALKYNIPVFQPEKLRKEYEEIFKYEPDLIVTAAYGQLLPNELLDYPSFGSINVHASLLPELRGGAPIHHAIIQGKKETGISIMYMVEKLDAGDVIAQQTVPIAADDHVGILHDKLSEVGATLLIDTLPAIFARTNERMKQDESRVTFASNISRDDEKINWDLPHTDVYNQIRGLNPWPVAYCEYKGERVKVWWATTDDTVYEENNPGEIVHLENNESITVVCGNKKAIQITDIQPAGRRKMKVSDFLLGNPEAVEIGQFME